jgi:hypothetical protein
MVAIRKNTEMKLIQFDEFTKPCKILKTIYKKAHCCGYLVSVAMPDNREETRFLQVFPALQKNLCQTTEDKLICAFGRDKIRQYNGFKDASYLLINLPPNVLQWRSVLRKPLSQRLGVLAQLGNSLTDTANPGLVLNGIDTRTFVWMDDGSLCNWDLQDALCVAEASEEDLQKNRRKCALDFTQLFIQALAGRTIKEKKCLTQLKLALYGRMDPSDQQQLLELLDKYLSCEDCTDLEPLLSALEWAEYSAAEYVQKNTANKDTALAVANFLHKNPLWQYVQKTPAGEQHLKIVIVGASPMRKAFLDTIIPCAQMLDTQMHIRIVSEDAAQFATRYLENAPLLRQVAQITHIPHRPLQVNTINELLTGRDRLGKATPFVNLTFEKAVTPSNATLQDAGCILVMKSLTEPLRNALLSLDATTHRPVLFGLHNAIPHLKDPQALGSSTTIDCFSKARGADLTKSVIYKKALAVHTFYEKEYNERISRAKILENFQDPYNRDSSVRSTLSIPYKLAAYGLAGCADAPDRFRNEVLQNEARLRRLIWLEHRSWQAFLIIKGWTLDIENYENDFADNGHNHKNKATRWHACLFGSWDTPQAPLSNWSLDAWDTSDPSALDPLDKMSVTTHRLLANYVANDITPKLEQNLHLLKDQLSFEDWQQLEHASSALKANATNAYVGWTRVLKDIIKIVEQENRSNSAQLNNLLEDVSKQADVIKKRNDRQQYKDVDRAILEAIPYLESKNTIRCIYKLWTDTGHPWLNMASAFFIEPQQVCFLTTDGQIGPDRKQIESFLCDRRQIEVSVKVLPLQELTKISEGCVLDVTGVDITQLLSVTKHLNKMKATVPIIHYKDGKVQSLDGNCPLLHCYRQNQTLNVEEMMTITGAAVHNENEFVPMHRLVRYEELWQTAQTINKYNTFCDFLSACIQKWKVLPSRYEGKTPLWRLLYTREEADKIGLRAVLSSLTTAHVIKPVQWNEKNVTAIHPCYQDSLNQLLDAYVKRKGANLKLSFQSDDVDALCELENLNLYFDHPFEKRWNQKDEQGQVCVEQGKITRYLNVDDLSNGLETLIEKGFIKRVKGASLLENVTITKKKKNGAEKRVPAIRVRFQFADVPTMNCLTKAGNVLEALAYHTIRKMDKFDDIKLGVYILWGNQSGQGTPTQNEIDLVCTKGTKSCLISCKKTEKLLPAHINEVRYETDRFGVDGTAILLTTAQESENAAAYARARHMGVEIITVPDKQQGNKPDNSASIVRKRISEILNKMKA